MFLIISEENDLSTDLVIDYLVYNKVSFYRLNETENSEVFSILVEGSDWKYV